jgi:hypothetical protein
MISKSLVCETKQFSSLLLDLIFLARTVSTMCPKWNNVIFSVTRPGEGSKMLFLFNKQVDKHEIAILLHVVALSSGQTIVLSHVVV